jgi:hypothetical protein
MSTCSADHRKKNNIWDCSDGILPLSWITKRWKTLPAFHQLLIQPHLTNILDVTEFWRSTTLLKSVWNRTAAAQNLTFGRRIDRNTGSPEYQYGSQLSFPMLHKTAPNSWRFASYGSRKLNRLLNQQFWTDCTFLHKSEFLAKFCHDLPRNFVH